MYLNLYYIQYVFLFIALLFSIWGVSGKTYKSDLRFFPVFLLIMLAVELTAVYLSNQNRHNTFIYNLEAVFEFGFYLFFLQRVNSRYTNTKPLNFLIPAFLGLYLVNIFYFQGREVFNTYTFILGCVFVIVLCIQYFILIVKVSPKFIYWREPIFWIVLGLLFYHSMMLPFFGIINYFETRPNISQILLFIPLVYNSILYLMFIMAFIFNKKGKVERSGLRP